MTGCNGLLGVSLLNLFPLPREAGFRRSFAYAGEAVDRGYSVLVFPEGRLTTTGEMNPFRSGIGLLAENLGIPVLPMRIDGLFEIKQAGKKFAPPRKDHRTYWQTHALRAGDNAGTDRQPTRGSGEGGVNFSRSRSLLFVHGGSSCWIAACGLISGILACRSRRLIAGKSVCLNSFQRRITSSRSWSMRAAGLQLCGGRFRIHVPDLLIQA